MKYILAFTVLMVNNLTFGQSDFPVFLEGTWKMENKEIYEHWDKLNPNTLKGLTYELINGQMVVSEYLEITRKGDYIVYTASVIGQNQGKGIEFKLTPTDGTYAFENPSHDSPKRIVYQKISETEIIVQISDGKLKLSSYMMTKQNICREEKDPAIANPNYDGTLAKKLGGDSYGMKNYFFVMLKTGKNETTNQELISESFKGHMANINRLVEENKLIVAGPLAKNDYNYRGIFILNNISSAEDAKELLQTDPAIKNGLLDYEIFTWYGSAALPEYLPASKKIWKLKP